MDVDLGMTMAVVDDGRYRTLAEALRQSGFQPDTNAAGRLTRQRWRLCEEGGVTVDFLVEPPSEARRGGDLLDLEGDFAAIITPGLGHAFRDREVKELTGETILGERASRDIGICGPGAFVLLKALAFGSRARAKDAYDLIWMLQSYGRGVEEVAERFAALPEDGDLVVARSVLHRDFTDHDAIGPVGVARFLTGELDDGIQADAASFVTRFLREVTRGRR
jgi:hypothetical protein